MAHGSARRHISDDPQINRLHRHIEFILAGAAGLFIVYTTCLPAIGVSLDATPQPVGGPSMQDAVQNLILYAPLGFFLALALRRRRMSWWVIFGLTTFGGTLLSIMAESLQGFMPGRVSSSIDVVCNGIGTVGGALAAWLFRELTRHQGRRVRDHLPAQAVRAAARPRIDDLPTFQVDRVDLR